MNNRISRLSIFALAGLVTLFTLFPSGALAVWKTKIVDGKSFGDFYPRALALEKGSNLPHIAYGGSHLFHAFFDGSSWKKEVVDADPSVGLYASLALDSNNKIHISYYDATNASLKYATNKSGSWVKVTVDTGGVGEYSSIAIDTNDNVHISYYDATSRRLKYSTNETGTWMKAFIDTSGSVGKYNAIAIDSHNKAHISYYDASNEALKYATNKTGLWVISTLETGRVGKYTSIAVDSLNKVHISYSSGTGGISGSSCTLRYATNKSGAWKISIIDTVDMFGAGTSITMDFNNKVHIGYAVAVNSLDSIFRHLKYATNESGTWVKATIASDTVGFASIAADSNNKIHLSYIDDSATAGPKLKYATNTTGAWVLSSVDSAKFAGYDTSLAIDSNNKVHVSYTDVFNNLKYATNKSGKWVKTTIESNGMIVSTSLAIDSGNKVHISYYDWSDMELKYTTNKSGVWVKKALASGWMDSSIVIDSSDKVHISYRDRSNMSLKYATNKSGEWLISTVDTDTVDNGTVGESSSIAIDSNDKVHISYSYRRFFQPSPVDPPTRIGHLKYATNKSGSWIKKTLDNSADAGGFSSIAIDSKDKVHISYDDTANHTLKYTTNKSGLWIKSTLDTGVVWGCSIALDSSDNAHISYRAGNDYHSSLKFATNSSGAWSTSTIDNSGDVGAFSSIAIDSADRVHIGYSDSDCLKYATDAY